MRIWIFLLVCLLSSSVRAGDGDGDYAVSKIPDSLKTNANVVKRKERMQFIINNEKKAVTTHTVAYTILNEQGDRWAYFSENYDRFNSIESFNGTLFDKDGKEIKRLKKSDVRDVSGGENGNLFDDNRYKWHNFYHKSYPYTIEYEVEVKHKGTMFLPEWTPQESHMMSVQQSEFVISVPSENKLRYKVFNYAGEPAINSDNGANVYTWEVKNLSAVELEYAMPEWSRLTTTVVCAADKFFIDDYQGSNSTWKEFGQFLYDLKKDRDQLPDDIKSKVHQLTDGISPVSEKIRVLYQYMQENTRYVSVQLGIGGWQPFDAKYVGTKKYGDCKALSNFMYSLLKEAGIRSVYTVITYSDNNDYLITDLPCSQFNHVVLFVPNGQDTTWLECTNQTVSPGFMGSVGNRFALAVDENGGSLVRTPSYGLNENIERRNLKATIDENGNLQAIIKTEYMAEMQEGLSNFIHGVSKDKVMEYLKENIELPSYDVNSYEYRQEKGKLPVVLETLDIVASNYATVSGKRFFVIPNLISRRSTKLKQDENRRFDIDIELAYKEIDTAEIIIPKGYSIESVPQDIKMESKFGKYTATVKVDAEKITYFRSYEHPSGLFPAKEYTDLVKFNDAVYKADRNKVVLIKN